MYGARSMLCVGCRCHLRGGYASREAIRPAPWRTEERDVWMQVAPSASGATSTAPYPAEAGMALVPCVAATALFLVVDGSGCDHGFSAAVLAAHVVRDATVTDGITPRDRHRITRLDDRFLPHRWHAVCQGLCRSRSAICHGCPWLSGVSNP